MSLEWVMETKELEEKGFFRMKDMCGEGDIMKGEIDYLIYEFKHENGEKYRFYRSYHLDKEDEAVYAKDLFNDRVVEVGGNATN